jgi:hypothetical protein
MPATKRLRTNARKKASTKVEDVDLDALIEEATVDAHDESEQVLGLYTMMEEHLDVPFQTSVLGVRVNVDRVELNDADQIVAACSRGGVRQRIGLLDLPLSKPAPGGAEWIEAYRRWARRR